MDGHGSEGSTDGNRTSEDPTGSASTGTSPPIRTLPGALVVGAGPAGLMAADILSAAGHPVLIADAMPSPARKLLMAGRSGLNLTRDEPPDAFRARFALPDDALPPALRTALLDFGPVEAMAWARGLGQEVFTGSTARVFPLAWKASPLLRAWLARLDAQGARLAVRWRWMGFEDGLSRFETPEGPVLVDAGATILAMGGASWRRLGSDGAWADAMADLTAPFAPANMGLTVAWTPAMAPHMGAAVKGCAWLAGGLVSRGEAVVSVRGLEGGGLYALSRPLRDGAPLTVDLVPDLSPEVLRARLEGRGRESLSNHLRKRLRLEGVRMALLQEWGRPLPTDLDALARLLKGLPVRHDGPRPLDEAISTAGGLRFDALDGALMLRPQPGHPRGLFAAGEMLDWEAPTGGYLITAALATGARAGKGAADWLDGAAKAPDTVPTCFPSPPASG